MAGDEDDRSRFLVRFDPVGGYPALFEFEQTERKLSTWIVAGTTLKKLEHVCNEIKRLEAEFRCGRYYPDLLDEQIVINREELRLIPADPVETSQPVYL